VRVSGRAWALLLVLATGCRHAPAPAGALSQLQLSFAQEGEGRLAFSLEVPPGPLSLLRWELWLDGARLAAGTELVERPASGALKLEVPLVLKRVSWRTGPLYAQVELRAWWSEAAGSTPEAALKRELILERAPVVRVFDAASGG
jgi:hypothetical protein